MVNINLLPKEIIDKQKLQQVILLISFGVVIIVFVSLFFYLSKVSAKAQLELSILEIEKNLRELQPVVDEVAKLRSKKAVLEERKALVERLLNSGLVYPRFMKDLLEVIPEGVWLTSMNTQSVLNNEKTISSIKITLSCNSYDKFVIADFVSNLENSNKFTNVVLGQINITQQQKNYELHTFNIECNYVVK